MTKYTVVICTSCRTKTNRGLSDPCKRGCPRCLSPVTLVDGVRVARSRKQHRRSISVNPETHARLLELVRRRMQAQPKGMPSASGLAEEAIHALCDAEGVPRVDRNEAKAARVAAAAERIAVPPIAAVYREEAHAHVAEAVRTAAAEIDATADVDDDDAMPEQICSDCGGPANGPDDAQCVNCDCGSVVCSACCEAFDGESYCSDCAAEKRDAARVVATEPVGGVHTW